MAYSGLRDPILWEDQIIRVYMLVECCSFTLGSPVDIVHGVTDGRESVVKLICHFPII